MRKRSERSALPPSQTGYPTPRSRRGFSLVEASMVITCVLLLFSVTLQLLSYGSASSLEGMQQIDTILEGRRVLRQVYADLKNACLELDGRKMDFSFTMMLQASGSIPDVEYSFLSFPGQGSIEDAVPATAQGRADRRASRITYYLEENPRLGAPFLQLVRREQYNPGHPLAAQYPEGTISRVLSDRVSRFQVDPQTLPSGGREWNGYRITLQLLDTIRPDSLKGVPLSDTPGNLPRGTRIADFFDVVYPEFFRAFAGRDMYNPNWHSGIAGP